jgi:hypothetical protein
MIMGTKTYDSATDMITFSRASGGTALRKVSYGNELVTNGDFSSGSTGWAVQGGWTFAGGKATNDGTNDWSLQQTNLVTVGKTYSISFDVIDYVSGNISVGLNSGGGSTAVSANGSYVVTETATETYFKGYPRSTFVGSIDNVSVKEVTFDQADGTLELFNHPANIPRIEYDAASAVKGLLIEEARTNLVTYSEDFTNAAWVDSTPVIVTPNQAVSPDGTQNADSVELVSNGDYKYQLSAVSASTQYSFSWYIKAGTATVHVYGFYDQSNAAWVDQTKYTITDGESVGNGWYRVTKTVTTPIGCTSLRIYPLRTNDSVGYDPDTIGTSILYGAQFEVGSFASSYIPTSGASATRAADVATIPTSAFGYNDAAGTVVVEAQRFGTNVYPRSVMIDSGSEADSIGLGAWGLLTSLSSLIKVGNVAQASMNTGNVGTSAFKNSLAYKENDFAASRDGGAVLTDTSGVVQTGLTTLRIGRNALKEQFFNGHIKSIQYYPRRLSNAQLQELTT